MFANDKSIDNLEALFKEIKKHIELQGQYIKLDLVEKLTILLSTLILILALIILGAMALYYFSFMLVYALVPVVGSIIASYAVIGAVILIAAIFILCAENLYSSLWSTSWPGCSLKTPINDHDYE